jgi:DNA topoisomerase-1
MDVGKILFRLKCKMVLDNVIIPKFDRNNIIDLFKIFKFLIADKKNKWIINNITKNNSISYPKAPFITSTLQQDAYYKYKFNPDVTMKLAQQLYEKGYITYMRTDSPTLSKDALTSILEYINETYGNEYSKTRQYKSKNSNSQDAHEAIRPTNISVLSSNINNVDANAIKLYKLIWEQTIMSQMAESINTNINISIKLLVNNDDIKKYKISKMLNIPDFVGSISEISKIGYKIIQLKETNKTYSMESDLFSKLKNNDSLSINFIDMISDEQLNSSSPLFNQPMLIKTLEKYSIGRPSTYAALLKKIMDYKYVEINDVSGYEKNLMDIILKNNQLKINFRNTSIGSEKQKLIVTDLGKKVTTFLNEYFPQMMDYKFTIDMENKLDLIALNKINYKDVIKEFHMSLQKWLANINNKMFNKY